MTYHSVLIYDESGFFRGTTAIERISSELIDWVEFGGVPVLDAPADGVTYGRRNGAWRVLANVDATLIDDSSVGAATTWSSNRIVASTVSPTAMSAAISALESSAMRLVGYVAATQAELPASPPDGSYWYVGTSLPDGTSFLSPVYRYTGGTWVAGQTYSAQLLDLWHYVAADENWYWNGVWERADFNVDMSLYYTSAQVDGLLAAKQGVASGSGYQYVSSGAWVPFQATDAVINDGASAGGSRTWSIDRLVSYVNSQVAGGQAGSATSAAIGLTQYATAAEMSAGVNSRGLTPGIAKGYVDAGLATKVTDVSVAGSYVRASGSWVSAASAGIQDVTNAGTYFRTSGSWTSATAAVVTPLVSTATSDVAGRITDAPSNGSQYVRSNGAWAIVTPTTVSVFASSNSAGAVAWLSSAGTGSIAVI